MSRKVDYMRISVTDRCNLRCSYCIPKEGIPVFLHKDILTFEEIVRLVKIFSSLGGKKIRLTGGEPLVRKGIEELIGKINSVNGIEKICLTTNGTLLSKNLPALREAGLDQINISLDTLDRKKFHRITGYDRINDVLDGIKRLESQGFKSTRLNVVIMKNINDDEIYDFIKFAMKNNLILRFIEFMKVTPLWKKEHYLPVCEIRDICKKRYKLGTLYNQGPSPAEYFSIQNNKIGFIRTDRENCEQCNRLRITAIGKLKVCLYEDEGIDIKCLMREGYDDNCIAGVIRSKMGIKNDVNYSKWDNSNIFMSSVGG